MRVILTPPFLSSRRLKILLNDGRVDFLNWESPVMSHPDHIEQFVELMIEYRLDAFIISTADEYQSEYCQESRQRLKWLCNFSGSNGTLIVTKDDLHYFFTDGRYIMQAINELAPGKYKILDTKDKTPSQWIKDDLSQHYHVGYNPELFTLAELRKYDRALRPIESNPVDQLWDREFNFNQVVVLHPMQYAGEGSQDKCLKIANLFVNEDCLLISDRHCISWLANIRRESFLYDPAVFCRAILHKNGSLDLFLEEGSTFKSDDRHSSHIRILNISQLHKHIEPLNNIGIDITTLPLSIHHLLEGKDLTEVPKNIEAAMAKKNDTELQGAIDAHVHDGVAVTTFLYWLEQQMANNNPVTEMSAAEKLLEFRHKVDLFQGNSFATISAFAENGAMIHYTASEKTNKLIQGNCLYLVDSGGQYLDGTTDVTRTVLIGKATSEYKDRFTRVLKGHIALAQAIFPPKTSGSRLDVLARTSLWQVGLDYSHGTGHGVGSYLSVHEGPQAISHRNYVPLEAGMIVSNEPGYYKTGEYGIRIENLMYIDKREDEFLQFKPLTCVPIDTRLVDFSLLNSEENSWLKKYHDFVYRSIAEYLDSEVKEWLSGFLDI